MLRGVVKNIRNRIIAGGGEVHFRTEVTKILEENGRVTGVMTADGAVIETDHVILSVGHSARDLFAELDRMKVFMEPKPFAVGLRIQHPQAQIMYEFLKNYYIPDSRMPFPMLRLTGLSYDIFHAAQCLQRGWKIRCHPNHAPA